jgi:L-malate glycosyltransferase
MKIGIVCYPTYGGSGVVATELGKALAQKGHQVHFITSSQPQRLDYFSENLFYHEVDVFNYALFQYPPYELALASKLVNVVEYERLDVLHVHYAIPHASAAILARSILKKKGINIPVITTLHGTDITLVGKNVSYEPVVTYSINESDGVTAVSHSLRAETLETFAIEREIEVIPNFIDLHRFKKYKKDHFKSVMCPNGEKLIVHTSNFRKVKRIEDAVEVFNEIRKVMPVKMLLVGDGPERPKIEQQVRDLDLQQDVRFIGKVDAVEEVLSMADLFIMPSEKESFGLAALEAMACEVPVISSNTGGLPELQINGLTGYMSNVGDIDDMVQKALFVLDDANLPRFKQQALERAKQLDIEVIVKHYEEYYTTVLERFHAIA